MGEVVKVNSHARIELRHSARPGAVVVKKWAALGFEWFGAKNPALPGILRDLHAMGEASYTDGNDTLFMKALDPMYVEDDAT